MWKKRKASNKMIFNKEKFDPVVVATSVVDFVDEFNKANPKRSGQYFRNQLEKQEPPNLDSLKLNVDAGCFEDGTTSLGKLIRDHQGNGIYAATKFEDVHISSTLDEATGLRWSFNLAKETRYGNLFDAETVVQCLRWSLNLAKETRYGNLFDAETVVQCLDGALKLVEIDNVTSDCMNLMSSIINFRLFFIYGAKNLATK